MRSVASAAIRSIEIGVVEEPKAAPAGAGSRSSSSGSAPPLAAGQENTVVSGAL